MKYLSKITIALILIITFSACEDDFQNEQQIDLVDNSKNISKLINSFDFVTKKYIDNPKLSSDKLGELFIENSRESGLSIVELNSGNSITKSNTGELKFSDEFAGYSNEIQFANSFSTKEDYKNNLTGLNDAVLSSKISKEEKQLLVDNIAFMIAFVDWMEALDAENSSNGRSYLKTSDCDGWWSCWGKCAAGTIGGAITGAIAGCGVGGSVGAAAGAAVGSLAAGVGAVPGAGVGAVVGCAAGGVAGAIGGGLAGAAAACD